MKKLYIILTLLATVIFTSCQDCAGMKHWFCLMECEDGTTCEVEYISRITYINNVPDKKPRKDIIEYQPGELNCSEITTGIVLVNSDVPEEFDFTLRRTSGSGACMIYLANGNIGFSAPDSLKNSEFNSPIINEKFAEWLKDNSRYRIKLDDDNPNLTIAIR